SMDVRSLVESCLKTKEEGWKFVRWGLPQDGQLLEPRPSVLASIEQFRAVREAVGDEIEICFDVHTRLDLPDALWLCREVEQFRPFFVEDPLRSENPDSFKTLRGRTGVPLAAGEQFSSKWEFRQLIEEEWIDYARIDLCIAGGFTEARKIAGWCETHYIKLAVHNPLGPVSTGRSQQERSARIMLAQTIQDAMNEQIKHEFDSAYLYLSMSAYCESNTLPGFARWLTVQAREEIEHAMKFYTFIHDRNGRVQL